MFNFDSQPSLEDHLLLKQFSEMEQQYELIMPIDGEYDPTWCRDTFLRQLFAELELDETSTSSSADASNQSVLSDDSQLSLDTFLEKLNPIRSLDDIKVDGDIKSQTDTPSVLMGPTKARYDKLLESMKRSSIYFVFARAIRRLRILQSISLDFGGISLSDLPHKIFEWSMDGLFSRAKLADDVYIDVLIRKYSWDELNQAKYSTDLLEILRNYKYFYTVAYETNTNEKMLDTIWDQQKLLQIGEQLDNNLQISIEELYNIQERKRQFSVEWRSRYERNMVRNCKRHTMEATLRMPIEWRYVRDYYASLVEMQCLKDNQSVLKIQEQIEELKDMIEKDNYATHVDLFVNHILIEKYEARIIEYSIKLTNELDHWDVQIGLAKNRLNKAQQQQRELQEKIDFMRRGIAEVRDLIKADAQVKIYNMVR
ncbi:GH11329 [Drosophila grimshawi]|uniref:GH11329 n=1 Tax=Drosophila grimshawi TaxID=7222 RepID=B4JE81_DROGR|nr:GH11329 [Drosophila grimshawi]